MQLSLWHKKTPNYPWEKANPPSPSGVEPIAHLTPNKKPWTSQEDRRKESNQRTSRKSQENPWHDHSNKGKSKSKRSGDHLKIQHTQGGRRQARHDRSPGEGEDAIYLGRTLEKEEGDSAIPSSQRQAVMNRGHSLNGEEVVMDTSQVVVGTSQKGGEAVGCQPIRP